MKAFGLNCDLAPSLVMENSSSGWVRAVLLVLEVNTTFQICSFLISSSLLELLSWTFQIQQSTFEIIKIGMPFADDCPVLSHITFCNIKD